jgi:hypothetical protein
VSPASSIHRQALVFVPKGTNKKRDSRKEGIKNRRQNGNLSPQKVDSLRSKKYPRVVTVKAEKSQE